MVRANIKSPDNQYIGVIDQGGDGFRILWLNIVNNVPGYSRSGEDVLYRTFQEACAGVYQVRQDADIIETIYFGSGRKS